MGFGLNSNQDLFIFNFPSDFVPPEINDRYMPHLKNYHKPFNSILDYLNSEIKEINLPGLSINTVEQSQYYGKKINFRSGAAPTDAYTREFTVVMRNIDSNVNYSILEDLWILHYRRIGKPYLDDFIVTTLDTQDRELFKTYYRQILYKGISDLTLSNERKDGEEKTFTLTFSCNFIDKEYIPRFDTDITDGTIIEHYYDELKNNTED